MLWLEKYIPLLILFLLLASCGGTGPRAVPSSPTKAAPAMTPSPVEEPIYTQARRLGRGVNLGNALEAPKEGEWGMMLEADFFRLIKEGGFNSVRVPIRWSAHAQEKSPYQIDPAFFARIDWVVEQGQKNGLVVILDMHHYLEIMDDPAGQRERYLALWGQIAEHYQQAPDSVYFELLNEPNGKIAGGETWNDLAAEAIQVVRKTNPTRALIIGPGSWNSLYSLPGLKLPEEDRGLIVTFHYYDPFHFTHQGAEWVDGSGAWLGTTWTATTSQARDVRVGFDRAVEWGRKNRRPLFLGEFGAYSKAPMDSRASWTAFVAREAEARGISWSYWEFGAGFGVYDRAARQWVAPIYHALIP